MRKLNNKNLECDVLIIGSGAGGSAVAETLTKKGLEVLMLEEGPNIHPKLSPKDATESFVQQWRSGGLNAALGNPIITYAEGRCVGGGTEINSAIMQKPPEELIEKWRTKYKIDQFTVNEVYSYINQALERVNASYTPQPHGKPSEIITLGAKKLGWKVKELKRAQKESIDLNPFASGTANFGKQSMNVSLIPESIERGMKLIPNCRVIKLYKNGSCVTSVKAITRDDSRNKINLKINAKNIFLCCGAIYSPSLLLSNGLSKNAGNNLQMPPTLKVIAKFPDRISASQSHIPLHAITEFMPNIRLGGSIFTPGIFAMSLAEDWDTRKDLMKKYDYCGIYYSMIKGSGKGRVRASRFSSEPLVSYSLSESDWVNMKNGTRYLAELMFASGAQKVIPSIDGHQGWETLDDIIHEYNHKEFIREKTYLSSLHLFGSCPIGENIGSKTPLCVANSFGKLHEFNNIYIADASIIPEAIGVNPQATVMGLAYRVAEAFLANL